MFVCAALVLQDVTPHAVFEHAGAWNRAWVSIQIFEREKKSM